jgi:hypothetical protein
MTPEQLREFNSTALRRYILNFRDQKGKIPYVVGEFHVLGAYELNDRDFIPKGLGVLLQSKDFPRVFVDQLLPSTSLPKQGATGFLPTGSVFELHRLRDISAVLHVHVSPDRSMLVTVVPLSYGTWTRKDARGSLQTAPPREIQISGTLPCATQARFDAAQRAYAAFRRIQMTRAEGSEPEEETEPLVVRLDSVGGALPAVPIPSAGNTKRPASAQTATVKKPTPATILPLPVAENGSNPSAVPSPTPEPEEAGVARAIPTGGWRTYAPGQQPAGKTLTVREASNMVDGFDASAMIYLRGQFVVTATFGNRASLRDQRALRDATSDPTVPVTNGALIFVEFPTRGPVPAAGTQLSRDIDQAFQITGVRRAPNGQITILAREITQTPPTQ